MADRITLRAGPLTMAFDPSAGWLRHLRLAGRDVLRAIYPAVRDRFWNTLPNRLSNLAVESGEAGFRIAFDAECRQAEIDFAFRAEITGTADGSVTYRFDGEPRTAFLRNRIGLCVLHPIGGCAGRSCVIEHTDGTTERSQFPAEIAPHQPFHDVRAIRHEVLPGVSAEVWFDGDVFETEDQRNWTDASFKTYSTPLALPFPAEVRPGTPIRQVVTLRLSGNPPRSEPETAGVSTVKTGGRQLDRLPRLGFGTGERPLDPRSAELIRALRPHHLRVDLVPSDPGVGDRLRAAAADASAVGAGLEVAVLLGDDPERELRQLADVIRGIRPPVRSWLVCRGMSGVAGADELALARRHLGEYDPAARFGVGTNLYFTQFNRTRPPLGDAEFVGFSVNPQVHAFDDESVIETLDGQSAVAADAARLAGGRAVAVTPITLRPRFNPNGGEAAPADPRQSTRFAAAWTLGSIRRLAEAGVAGITYFETTGPAGLLTGDRAYPVYDLFEDLADVSEWSVDLCRCSHPLVVEGMVFDDGNRRVAYIGNLTPEEQDVALPFVGGRPVSLNGQAESPLNEGRLRLPPYGLVRVEGTGADYPLAGSW